MGVNEKGVVIGNEAQGSRLGGEEPIGLLGMDLLRLGLERGATAKEAMNVIIKLLEQFGQNGNAHLHDEYRYDNSYLIMDRKEVWLLETAGRMWVAKQIYGKYAISNCYTIGKDKNDCSEYLESYARKRKWVLPYEPFHFAKAYTMPAIRQTNSVCRWRRMKQLLEKDEKQNFMTLKKIFRDHYEGEVIEPRFGAAYGTFASICMHALTITASQTAASMLVTYREGLGIVIRYAFSIPCTSLYLPVYYTGTVPEKMQRSGGVFSENSLWWLFERLAAIVKVDYERFAPLLMKACEEVEEEISNQAFHTEEKAILFLKQGNFAAALNILNEQMEMATEKAAAFAEEQFILIHKQIVDGGGFGGPCHDFLKAYCTGAQMEL